MMIANVEYRLQDGYIHNWLTAGPQSILLDSLVLEHAEELNTKVYQKYHTKASGITQTPVERGPLTEGVFKLGAYEGSWSYTRCGEDHLLDHSVKTPVCHFVRSWAYTRLVSPADRPVSFILTAVGPADVWLNGKPVLQSDQFYSLPARLNFTGSLKAGENEVLLRFEGVAAPDFLLIAALRIADPDGISVCIPSLIPSIDRRNELEEIYQLIYLDKDVYAIDDMVYLRWPEGGEKPSYNDARLQNLAGQIYAQAEDVGKPGERLYLANTASLAEGEYEAFVLPRAWEYYESQIRITQELPAYVMGMNRFSISPYGTFAERSQEALTNAAKREGSLFAEIAKMVLGWWDQLELDEITKAIEAVNQRQDGSDLLLLGLLGMVQRFGSKPEFPRWIKKQIKACILGFKYWSDEPGRDVMDFSSENHRILFHACEILAGQLYPNEIFKNNGENGRQHLKKGEKLALAWLQEHGAGGFSEWGSKQVFSDTLAALSHLVDLARSESVFELSAILMDKIFFEIAVNSFNGVFGTSQGWSRTMEVRSGLLGATSGITRVMWGQGVFNAQISGTVSLACMKKYELPPIISDIAAGKNEEIWNKQQSGSSQAKPRVNTVTYRTPDYLLSSAQDYRKGEGGKYEHIWQATLGPNCVVFTNHPGSSSVKEACAPNTWRGNGVLPRVAQWKDTLLAIYNLPEGAGLGFTHAYFPTFNFDEYVLSGGWAFGRMGDGYLALTCSTGIELMKTGATAFRELRSYGKEAIWVCQMGRAALDGDFDAFQEKVIGLKLAFSGLMVEMDTLRSDVLALGWEGPFYRNGSEQPLEGFLHFDNPYTQTGLPCTKMEVRTDVYVLTLDFS